MCARVWEHNRTGNRMLRFGEKKLTSSHISSHLAKCSGIWGCMPLGLCLGPLPPCWELGEGVETEERDLSLYPFGLKEQLPFILN